MENFERLDLPEVLRISLKEMGFSKPTPIQEKAIPAALAGKDVLGSAQTGTGKTAAYAIPLLTKILNDKKARALVLTPTRELADQVSRVLKTMLGKAEGVKTALLIGGEPIIKQLKQLSVFPRIIVGTPGRINDHLSRRSLSLAETTFAVLDETDRMLDLGFSVQLREIAKHLPRERQTLLFSATMAQEILKTAYGYLKDPVRITVGSTTSPAASVKQETIKASDADKYGLLLNCLEEREGSHIVFVKTKSAADRLAAKLGKQGHASEALHGDLRQKRRDKVIREFRDYEFRVLVATDVAARGLDIPHLRCVVNYDLPQCPEDYIHRVGRVGRAGAEGIAVNLLTGQDSNKWKAICKLIGSKPKEGEEVAPSAASPRKRNDNENTFKAAANHKPFEKRGAENRPFARSPFAKKTANKGAFERPTEGFKTRIAAFEPETANRKAKGAVKPAEKSTEPFAKRGFKPNEKPFGKKNFKSADFAVGGGRTDKKAPLAKLSLKRGAKPKFGAKK